MKEEHPPPYIIFVVVFFFFLTGLGGFLICHLLKKKGYRCHMEDDEEEEEEEEKLGVEEENEDEENQDTVEQILKCIIENEANMEAFNEMLGKQNVCVRHDPRLRKESIGGIPPHLHTVHSGTDLNTCHLCAQSRIKKGRRPSRTPRLKQRPGEQTVFSVGRFRVTHTDKKNSGVPNVLVGSGDLLDQSQDSEERKDGGYNLRNMFKDVRPPSENSNGVAPNLGKRKRSLTIFNLRRGSDPIGIRVDSTGRDTGGVRFTPQPVVLEEPPHTENGESGTKLDSKVKTESNKNHTHEAKTSHSNASTFKTGDSNVVTLEASEQGSSLEPKPKSFPSAAAVAPSSLPISFRTDTEETEKLNQFDPGPLQTSTPLYSLPESGEGIIQFTLQSGCPVPQTPPDPCTSPVLEHSFVSSPALISLGSSPHSSVKTPTLPLAITPSPKLSSKGTPKLTPSLKFLSDQTISSQSPLPSRSLDKSITSLPSQTSSPSTSLQDDAMPVSLERPAQDFESLHAKSATTLPATKDDLEVSVPTSPKQSQLEVSTTLPSVEKPKLKNLGILNTDKVSPQLSPSSPLGGRISSVTIVKASPDSKREFSVVTMVEEQKGTLETVAKEEQQEIWGEEVRSTLSQDKDDIVEMEDIKDCKVTQGEEVETSELKVE